MLASFPFDTPGGVCEKYDPAIGCTIYDQRPVICNFDQLYPVVRRVMEQTRQEFYRLIATGCNHDMDELGIDPSFRVVL